MQLYVYLLLVYKLFEKALCYVTYDQEQLNKPVLRYMTTIKQLRCTPLKIQYYSITLYRKESSGQNKSLW